MGISIEQPSGHRLAEARRISVHGLPGVGGYTLVINLHLSVTASTTDTYLSNLSIRVDWGDNQQRMIGTGVPDQAQPIRLSQYSNEVICDSTHKALCASAVHKTNKKTPCLCGEIIQTVKY